MSGGLLHALSSLSAVDLTRTPGPWRAAGLPTWGVKRKRLLHEPAGLGEPHASWTLEMRLAAAAAAAAVRAADDEARGISQEGLARQPGTSRRVRRPPERAPEIGP